MTQSKEKILNVPNTLTMMRMALIPVFWVLFMKEERYWALGVFVVASITDLLDGYISRKYNQVTNFGKLMDPLADKLMVISMMLVWALVGVVPWLPLCILVGKELVLLLGGLVMLKKGIVVSAKKAGKIAQACMVSSLILCFFNECWWEPLGVPVHLIVLWCAVALTLYALAFYVNDAVRLYKESKKQ